jgi:hypothetical protein
LFDLEQDPYRLVDANERIYEQNEALIREWRCTLDALKAWQTNFAASQMEAESDQSLFNCRILYCTIMLHLFTDIDDLHALALTKAPSSNHPLLLRMCRWAESSDATCAAQRALATLDTVAKELKRANNIQFNFLSYGELRYSYTNTMSN